MVSTTAGSVSNAVEGTWHSHRSSIPLALLGWEDDVFQTKWECMLESFAEKLCIRKIGTSFQSGF